MPPRAPHDNSLDDRGLRRVDPDGHPLYWHGSTADTDYGRDGMSGGVCTEGDVWDQDSATGRLARPGRLRRRIGESALLSGRGQIRGEWVIVPGEPRTWTIEVTCRGGDQFAHVPPWPDRVIDAEEFLHMLNANLLAQGWTFVPYIECPTHRAERKTVQQALEALRQQHIQALFEAAAPGTPATPHTVRALCLAPGLAS